MVLVGVSLLPSATLLFVVSAGVPSFVSFFEPSPSPFVASNLQRVSVLGFSAFCFSTEQFWFSLFYISLVSGISFCVGVYV